MVLSRLQRDLLNKHMEPPDFTTCRQDLVKIFKSNPGYDSNLARQAVLIHLLDRAGFRRQLRVAGDDDMTQVLTEEVIGPMAASWSVQSIWEDFEIGYSSPRSRESYEDTPKIKEGKVILKPEVDEHTLEFYSYDNELHKEITDLDEDNVESCGHNETLAESSIPPLLGKGKGFAHMPSGADLMIQDHQEDLPPPSAHPVHATSEPDSSILQGMLALDKMNWNWSRVELPDGPKTKHDKPLQFQVALAGVPISCKTLKGTRILKWIYQQCIQPFVANLLFKPLKWIWAKISILIPALIICGPQIWVRPWPALCPYISMANR